MFNAELPAACAIVVWRRVRREVSLRAVRRIGLVTLILVVLVVSGISCGNLYLRSATLPEKNGVLELEGLRQPVEIRREANGVPHIAARNEEDLLFALGVVHGQDRLWQMEFQRRTGAGRLSEVLGESTVDQDRFLRTWGFYRAAERAYENLSPGGRRSLDAYVAGINAYLDSDPGLPPEFRLLGHQPEPWRPADVLVWAKMMSFDLSNNYDTELENRRLRSRGLSPGRIRELTPPYPEDAPTVLRDATPAPPDGEEARLGALLEQYRAQPKFVEASNNWVVSGERTASGEPLLADDPHLGLQSPSLWYLAHLESPTLEAVGATLPGLPGVVIGRNDRIAWGVTNVGADVQDLYVLDETSDGRGYRYAGGVEPYRTREEVIRVKGAEDITLDMRETVHGPVVSGVVGDTAAEADGAPLALRWTSLESEDRTLESYLSVNRAGSWEEFNEALRDYKAPAQNFVYADVEGNIGYVAPGAYPIRREEHTGLYPAPGGGEWDWRGPVPFEEWPRSFNPEGGFFITANNKVTSEDYPHSLSLEWAEPYRAERIRRMIGERKDLTAQDMVSIQQDQHSLLYKDFRPVLERLEPRSGRGREWKRRLLSWDGDARPGSREAAVFAAWYAELTRLPADEVGTEHWDEPRYLIRALNQGDPACGSVEKCRAYASEALGRALGRPGIGDSAWGLPHQAVFEHPVLSETPLARFSDKKVPFGGDSSTVNVGHYDFETLQMSHGPSYRHVVDLADLENSLYIHAPGQSGNLLSGHYDDLLDLWRRGIYLPMQTDGYGVDHSLTLTSGD